MQAEPLLIWSDPIRELVGFIGTFLAAGAIGFRYSAARHQTAGTEASFYREGLKRAATLGIVGALIGVVFVLMDLPAAAAKLHLSSLQAVTSNLGIALSLIFALLTLAGLLLAWTGPRAGWPLAAIGIVGVAFQPAFLAKWISLVNPIHRLAAGLWIGTLFMLVVVGLVPLLRHEELRDRRGAIAADMVNRFSPLALSMGGVVLVLGAITAWRHLPVISDLWTTPYGYALLVKLALVATVFGLGAFNWRRQRPTLGSESAAISLKRSARHELTVAALVLVATAILVSLPSPPKPKSPPVILPISQR
jgi:putative copper export protein